MGRRISSKSDGSEKKEEKLCDSFQTAIQSLQILSNVITRKIKRWEPVRKRWEQGGGGVKSTGSGKFKSSPL